MRNYLRAIVVWSIVTVSALVGTVAVQAVNRGEANQAVKMSQQETGFWRVVAGEESGNDPSVGNLLGRDLRDILHDNDAINGFRGNSNRYGGITDDIGYDPFDETGLDCFECGPLDERTKNNLDLIRDGNLSQVTDPLVVDAPDEGFDVLPGDMGMLTAVVLWYLIGTSMAWAASRKQREIIPLALAPIPVGITLLNKRAREKRLDDQVRAAFPDHMKMLDQTNKVLDRYCDDPAAIEAVTRRDQVLAELQAQARVGSDGSSEIDSLTTQLGETMEFLHLRAEARKELG